eukprot:683037-Amphidinium_carterae.1
MPQVLCSTDVMSGPASGLGNTRERSESIDLLQRAAARQNGCKTQRQGASTSMHDDARVVVVMSLLNLVRVEAMPLMPVER